MANECTVMCHPSCILRMLQSVGGKTWSMFNIHTLHITEGTVVMDTTQRDICLNAIENLVLELSKVYSDEHLYSIVVEY